MYMLKFLAISEQDFDYSGEPGPQAKGVNHLETPSDNCTQLTGLPPVLCGVVTCHCVRNPGARGVEPETLRRRGQLLICPPTSAHAWSRPHHFYEWRQNIYALGEQLALGTGQPPARSMHSRESFLNVGAQHALMCTEHRVREIDVSASRVHKHCSTVLEI